MPNYRSALSLDTLKEMAKTMQPPVPNAVKVNARTFEHLKKQSELAELGFLAAFGFPPIGSTAILIDDYLSDGEFKEGFIRGGEFIEV